MLLHFLLAPVEGTRDDESVGSAVGNGGASVRSTVGNGASVGSTIGNIKVTDDGASVGTLIQNYGTLRKYTP